MWIRRLEFTAEESGIQVHVGRSKDTAGIWWDLGLWTPAMVAISVALPDYIQRHACRHGPSTPVGRPRSRCQGYMLSV